MSSANSKIQEDYYRDFKRRVNPQNLEHYLARRCTEILPQIEVPQGGLILDLGCGEGFFTQCLSRNTRGRAIGVDISYSRINKAKKRFPQETFVLCDAENLPFQDGSFHLIYCNALLHHLNRVARSVEELSRVVRAGSWVILIEPNRINPLMVGLGIANKAERGLFSLSIGQIISLFRRMIDCHIEVLPMNNYIYPYQKFPPLFMKSLFKKAEKIFEYKKISTHNLVIVKKMK